jgi:hypothetical protein
MRWSRKLSKQQNDPQPTGWGSAYLCLLMRTIIIMVMPSFVAVLTLCRQIKVSFTILGKLFCEVVHIAPPYIV